MPGIVGDFIVKERLDKLRSLLTVQGCTKYAYWVGTLLGDMALLSVALIFILLTWYIFKMTVFQNWGYWIMILSYFFQLVCFSYFWSFLFTSTKNSLTVLMSLGLRLVFIPIIAITIGNLLYNTLQPILYYVSLNATESQIDSLSLYIYSISVFSPQYGFLISLFNTLNLPNSGDIPLSLLNMIRVIECCLYFMFATHLDGTKLCKEKVKIDPFENTNNQFLDTLSTDVLSERESTQVIVNHMLTSDSSSDINNNTSISNNNNNNISTNNVTNDTNNSDMKIKYPLIIHALRKIFPPAFQFNLKSYFYCNSSTHTPSTHTHTTSDTDTSHLVNHNRNNILSSSSATTTSNTHATNRNTTNTTNRMITTANNNNDNDNNKKKKQATVAVENVSFHVEKGQIFGLLGANGAG